MIETGYCHLVTICLLFICYDERMPEGHVANNHVHVACMCPMPKVGPQHKAIMYSEAVTGSQHPCSCQVWPRHILL